MKSVWSVVTVDEGARARKTAIEFCESLIQRFWRRFDFEVSSWSFSDLERPEACSEAARKAVAADIIVFATEMGHALPWYIQGWIEQWVAERKEKEGSLAALWVPNLAPENHHLAYLRKVAHRAGMNFLTQVPEHIPDPLSDCPEVYAARAREMTSVMDDILRQPTPSRFI